MCTDLADIYMIHSVSDSTVAFSHPSAEIYVNCDFNPLPELLSDLDTSDIRRLSPLSIKFNKKVQHD